MWDTRALRFFLGVLFCVITQKKLKEHGIFFGIKIYDIEYSVNENN